MDMAEFLEWAETAPADRRAAAAHALARAFLTAAVDEDTRHAMEATLTVLLDDCSPDVRLAIADALGESPAAPRHVILVLAADQDEVAAAVLTRSPLFIDSELVDIVGGSSGFLQAAIAARPAVSSAVAAAVAEVGDRVACWRLIENQGAAIAGISLRRIAERFGDDPGMREHLLRRHGLPADVHQMLVRQVSDALSEMVAERAWVPEERARRITREACERATVALAAESERAELPALVEHLRITGQLTTALLLRAVCAGNIALFETALAALAHVPEARVQSMVRAGRMSSLKPIYLRAGLPPVAFDGFAAALDACRRIAEEGGPRDRYRFSRELVERVLARYHDITDGEMRELNTMLRRIAADQTREAARDRARAAAAAA
jgi:uncharacterized protein (DUF2336 family)